MRRYTALNPHSQCEHSSQSLNSAQQPLPMTQPRLLGQWLVCSAAHPRTNQAEGAERPLKVFLKTRLALCGPWPRSRTSFFGIRQKLRVSLNFLTNNPAQVNCVLNARSCCRCTATAPLSRIHPSSDGSGQVCPLQVQPQQPLFGAVKSPGTLPLLSLL